MQTGVDNGVIQSGDSNGDRQAKEERKTEREKEREWKVILHDQVENKVVLYR